MREARQFMRQGDLAKAALTYHRLLEQEPADGPALVGLVTLLVRADHIQDAEVRVAAFERKAPNAAEAKLARALIAFRSGNVKLAGDLLDSATVQLPLQPSYYLAAASLYRNLGRSYHGARLLQDAWKAGLTDPEVLQMLGNLYLKMMRPKGGEAALRAALKSQDASPDIHRDLGRALLRLHRNDEAEREFDAALSLDPSDSYSLYYLGLLALDEKNWLKAAQLFERSLQGDESNPAAHYAAGRALLQAGKNREAESHFARHAELMQQLYHRPMSERAPLVGQGEWVRWDASGKEEGDFADPDPLAISGKVKPGRFEFVDLAQEAGIRLQNVSGSRSKDYIVESLGSGACWLDYDGDGWLDLFIPNGLPMTAAAGDAPRDALYRNRGDGTFEDVTSAAGIRDTGWGHGCAVGDIDNDGDPDLYVTNRGPNALFRNNGNGTFTEMPHAAGADDPQWSTSAVFADYDSDGWLDLFVADYVAFDPANTPRPGSGEFCRLLGMPAFCGPRGLAPAHSRLYRGLGGGRFQDVTDAAGIVSARGVYSLGAVWGDVDDDGDPDLYVATDSTGNLLYINRGDGTFQERGTEMGVTYNEEGREQAGMGADMADYDNDGDLDIIVTNFSHDTNTLFRQGPAGLFDDVTAASGIGPPSYLTLGWGVGLVDLDNDGWKDIFVANGHTQPQVDDYDLGSRYRERKLLHVNLGDGTFEEAGLLAGPGMSAEMTSRGAAFADFDNDGDMDILVNNIDGKPSLLRNETGNRSHWIGLKLVGTTCNRDALGARVTLRSERGMQVMEARSGYSYLASNDSRILFGLGSDPIPRQIEIRIRWPGGKAQRFDGWRLDHYTNVQQPP